MIQFSPSRSAKTPLSWRELLGAWWITNRVEITIPLPIILAGSLVFLVLHHREFDWEFVRLLAAGLAVTWLAFIIGASLNCLGDYETDRLDEANKARLAEAIDAVGSGNLWRINLAEIGLTSLLVIALVVRLGRPWLLWLWLAGLALAIAYSFEPYKTKRRGLLSPVTVVLSSAILPMLFVHHLFAPRLSPDATILIGLFGLQVFAIALADQLSDYEVDLKSGMTTSCGRYGRHRTARLAAIIFSLASAGMLTVLGVLWPPTQARQVGLFLIACLSFFKVAADFWRLTRLGQAIEKTGGQEERRQAVAAFNRRVTTPLWLVLAGLGVWSVIGGSLLM